MRNFNIVLVLLLVSPALNAQNKVSLSLNPGVYLYNSENSFETSENASITWAPGFSIAYERDSLWGMTVHVEYAYTRSMAVNAIPFTFNTGTLASVSFGADLVSMSHHLDLGVCFKPCRSILLVLGPTIALSHRTIELTEPPIDVVPARHFEDRLVSMALGANASASFEIPIQEGPNYMFLLSTLKFRFLHAVWFDKRGRDLDNYFQDSFLTHLGFGVGYSF